MTRPRDIFTARSVLNRQHSFRYHLSSIRPDNVNSQYSIRFLIADELDHALRLQVRLGSAVGAEGKCAYVILNPCFFDLCLILSYPCDLGMCVHDGWNGIVVDVTVTFRDILDGSNAFFFSFMGKHRTECAITDNTDMWQLSPVLFVDDQAALVVDIQSDVFKTQSGSIRSAADGNEDDVGFELGNVSEFET